MSNARVHQVWKCAAVKIQHKNCWQSNLRKKIINTLFAGLGRPRYSRPLHWHSFSQYGPPGRQITYIYTIGHFWVALCLCFKTSLRAKLFKWKCSFSCWSKSFSYKKLSAKTRFAEVTNTRRMAYYELNLLNGYSSNFSPFRRNIITKEK